MYSLLFQTHFCFSTYVLNELICLPKYKPNGPLGFLTVAISHALHNKWLSQAAAGAKVMTVVSGEWCNIYFLSWQH